MIGSFFRNEVNRIGLNPIPEDLIVETERYLQEKEKMRLKEIDILGKNFAPQKKLYLSIKAYFERLEKHGMTDEEKNAGSDGLKLLKEHEKAFTS